MLLIGPSALILGLILASATAQETPGMAEYSMTTAVTRVTYNPAMGDNSTHTTGMPSRNNTMGITTATLSNVTGEMNSTTAHSTITLATTRETGGEVTQAVTTHGPVSPSKAEPDGDKEEDNKTTTAPQTSADTTVIVILAVIIIAALGFGVACFIVRKRGRRYSIDFTTRQDEANIPLSIMDPEATNETVSQNGLRTFENADMIIIESEEPEAKSEEQAEQKAEAEEPAVEPSAESAAPAPSPDESEDKPAEDAAEPSAPAPVQPSGEEKTDDEGVDSNQTSMESLKETNENNSNGAELSQKTANLDSSNASGVVPLDKE